MYSARHNICAAGFLAVSYRLMFCLLSRIQRVYEYGQDAGTPVDPLDGPVSLLLDAWHCGDGMEQAVLLSWVLDVGLKQQAVHLCRTAAQHR